MKFLIQKINGKIVHDFSITLLQAVDFKNWLAREKKEDKIVVKYFDSTPEATDFKFKPVHRHYVPVGTVEFVSSFLKHFYGLTPKPMNVPIELRYPAFAKRRLFNGTPDDLRTIGEHKVFVKSNDNIKGFSEIIDTSKEFNIPAGNYQVSDYLSGIDSEWRAFVYDGKLVGLQNYAGDFTVFPDVAIIKEMIKAYKSAPIAYTLDVGIQEFNHNNTFVIECHDFFSCGLYGFADYVIYPNMLHRWFGEYIQREMANQNLQQNG